MKNLSPLILDQCSPDQSSLLVLRERLASALVLRLARPALRLARLDFLLLHITSQYPHFLVPMLLEVKAILLAKSKLEQVVVQRLLAHTHLVSCVLETVANQIALSVNAVVQLPPQGNLLNDVCNRPFLGALCGLAHLLKFIYFIIKLFSVDQFAYSLRSQLICMPILLYPYFERLNSIDS